MKTKMNIILIAIAMLTSSIGFSQKTDKKIKTFTVIRTINASVDDVWKVVGEEFGAIANSHPKIVSSEFNQGFITGGENASRTCNFNEKGTKYLQEKQINFDAENHNFRVLIYSGGGLPLDTDYNYAVYSVKPVDDNSCILSMEVGLRTKPAFLGSFAKGKFKKTIGDYLLAVEHHVLTGENVNKDNFKTIKKKYNS